MSLLIPWLLFPLVLAALALGCGLLVEHASGRPLPTGLLLPAGLALVVAAGLFPALAGATAGLATPLVVALAAAGFALSLPLRGRRPDGSAAAAAVAVYAVYAAPVVLSGRATFLGFIKLDDTATYLAMLDRFMGHGYSLAGLAPSTYQATLATSLAYGYPMGSLVPLGIGHALVGQDAAWLWQPYLASLAAALALALYALASALVRSPSGRALTAFVAAQPALLYGYALWGGVKELASAALLALVAALLVTIPAHGRSLLWAIPPAVAAAAVLGVLSAGGTVWLLPALAAALLLLLHGRDRRAALSGGVCLAGLTSLLAIPTLDAAATWLAHSGDFTSGSELANLYRPLDGLQLFGIWPVGDFRVAPGGRVLDATHVLVGVAAAAACAGILLALRRRARSLLAYLAAVGVGAGVYVGAGSPWIGGKALATASPALLLVGLAGACAVFERGFRIEAALAIGAVAGGVLWSNVLGYHDVRLAPRGRLAELAAIGNRFAGDGPALMTEFDPYGARHFLRRLDAEGASELRRRYDTLRTGQLLPPGSSADVDELQLAGVLVYRTLVLRRSPAASRPPSVYRLVWRGRYYDVWQRPAAGGATILEHLSLGDRFHAAAVPRCSDVLRLARLAGRRGRLAAVVRPANAVVDLLPSAAPGRLGRYGEPAGVVYLQHAATLRRTVRVAAAGRYDIGVDGSFVGRLELVVNGRVLRSERHELNWPAEFQPFGTAVLRRGANEITLRYSGPDLRPGSGGAPPFGTGPLVIGPSLPRLPVTTVPPADASSLCGTTLDWVEAIRG